MKTKIIPRAAPKPTQPTNRKSLHEEHLPLEKGRALWVALAHPDPPSQVL